MTNQITYPIQSIEMEMAIMIGGALSAEMDGYSMSKTIGDVLNVKNTSTTVPDVSMEIDVLNVNQDGSHQ